MKVITTLCEGTALKILSKCFGKNNVRCAFTAEERFIEEAEVLIFLEWKPARELMRKMKNLKILQALSAGVDHIPQHEIPSGILLSSNSGSNAWAVAEHALALILSALKYIPTRDRAMRRGEFPQMLPSRLLRGKTVGIIGFGHIGQALARMLQPFDVNILAINRTGKYDGAMKIDYVGTMADLKYIFERGDIVVISIPLTEQTRNSIRKEHLNLMKRNAVLVNVARGKIINQQELFEFLQARNDVTAALDTWWHYGKEFHQDFPFETLENVILSPHCGGVYETWMEDAMKTACEKIKKLSSLSQS